MNDKKTKLRNFEDMAFGLEPEWWNQEITLEFNPELEIGKSFNWYNYTKTNKDAVEYLKKWMLKYYDKESIRNISKLKDWEIPNHLGWIARMISLGCTLIANDILQRFTKKIDELIQKGKERKEETEEQKVQEKVSSYKEKQYLAKIDEMIDCFLDTFSYEYDIYQELLKITKDKKEYKEILKHVNDTFLELDAAILKTDEDLIEIYSCFSTKEKKLYHSFLKSMIEQLVLLTKVELKPRKVSKKKVKTSNVKKQLDSIEYLSEYLELGIKSIPIENTLKPNIKCIVFYDIEKRKLHIMKKGEGTFFYKGKSLYGWDEETSFAYVLRKPKETILKLIGCNKKQFDLELNKLTTKPQSVNGKINSSMIVLKTF